MIYIVKAKEDGETFEYEYGCIEHAKEQYELEKNAELIEYNKGNYTLIESK